MKHWIRIGREADLATAHVSGAGNGSVGAIFKLEVDIKSGEQQTHPSRTLKVLRTKRYK